MNLPKHPPFVRSLVALGSLLSSSAIILGQGSLTPPGAPAPSMKTLQQVEPRTPISSLPFAITNPGSYFLVANLTGVSGTNGITIATGAITLDLRGFSLAGVPGSLNGITVTGNYTNVTIQNGTVTGWGGVGIFADPLASGNFSQLNVVGNMGDGLDAGYLALVSHCVASKNNGNGFGGVAYKSTFETCTGDANGGAGFSTYDGCSFLGCAAHDNGVDGFNPYFDCRFNDCAAAGNGFDGFDTPYIGCLLTHCLADNNGGQGIYLGDSGSVRDCVVYDSGLDGIVVGSSAVIESCSSSANQGVGILASNACLIMSCVSSSNSDAGIVVNANCQVKNCTAAFNTTGVNATNDCTISGCTADHNLLNGIQVTAACFIENNTVQANGGGNLGDGGIRCLGSSNRIDNNHLTDNLNNGLYLDAGGNTVTRNSAKGNTTNYSVGSGNDVGPIGAAATSTSPWANLQ